MSCAASPVLASAFMQQKEKSMSCLPCNRACRQKFPCDAEKRAVQLHSKFQRCAGSSAFH